MAYISAWNCYYFLSLLGTLLLGPFFSATVVPGLCNRFTLFLLIDFTAFSKVSILFYYLPFRESKTTLYSASIDYSYNTAALDLWISFSLWLIDFNLIETWSGSNPFVVLGNFFWKSLLFPVMPLLLLIV